MFRNLPELANPAFLAKMQDINSNLLRDIWEDRRYPFLSCVEILQFGNVFDIRMCYSLKEISSSFATVPVDDHKVMKLRNLSTY